MGSVNKITRLTLYLSVALIISYLESNFSFLFGIPGLKIGFANIVTLILLYTYGFKEAFVITLMRIVMISFFRGFTVAFYYSLAGGMLSLFGMYFALRFLKKLLSALGISLIGALLHNLAQSVVIGFIFKNFTLTLYWMPLMIFASLATGLVTGLLVLYLQKYPRLFKTN